MKKEESLQIAVCNYIRLQYPNVIFTSEASGLKLTIGQAVKAKKLRSSRGLPDLIILEVNHGFCGMCIELKNETPFKRNGDLKSSPHLQEQYFVLQQLNAQGYNAQFGIGFDHTKAIIDQYLKKPNF